MYYFAAGMAGKPEFFGADIARSAKTSMCRSGPPLSPHRKIAAQAAQRPARYLSVGNGTTPTNWVLTGQHHTGWLQHWWSDGSGPCAEAQRYGICPRGLKLCSRLWTTAALENPFITYETENLGFVERQMSWSASMEPTESLSLPSPRRLFRTMLLLKKSRHAAGLFAHLRM